MGLAQRMPRIDAASIEEHVRRQTARILDAATRLFREQGYRNTDLEDISGAVGLARNSLYRYYPGKDHILVACVRRDMLPFIDELQTLVERFPDPHERIGAWLDAQLDMATSPAHATMEMMAEIRQGDPALRRELTALHQLPNQVIETAVSEVLKGRRRDVRLVTALVGGLVEAAARQAMAPTASRAAIKRELRRAVAGLLAS
jgi:AcrR family transcriptional regulator